MTDTNYDAFRNNLIARDLIFPDAGLSEMSRRMNEWRYQHLLAMARVAASASEKVTVDENFESAEMMVFLDERFKLASAGLFSLEDLFEALTSLDSGYEAAPNSGAADFSLDGYASALESALAKSKEARPWRENESPLAVTKSAYPGMAPEIPLPPDLRKS